MTLPDWRVPMLRGVRTRRIRTGWPRFRIRSTCSASGIDKRAGRDRCDPLGEAHHAGVRVAVMIGADRADDDRRGALAAGDGRALAARCAELAIARAVHGARHGVGDEDDLAAHRLVGRGGQRFDAVERDQLGVDPLRRGRAAVAECGDDQRLRERRKDFGASPPLAPIPACRMSRSGHWRSPSLSVSPPTSRGRGLRPRSRRGAGRLRWSGLR